MFITAWNPLSLATADADNRRAATRLVVDVAALGLRALAHRGGGDDPSWPAEEGLFVLGMDEPTAVVLYTQRDFHAVTQTPDWAGAAYDGRIKLPVRGLSRLQASSGSMR